MSTGLLSGMGVLVTLLVVIGVAQRATPPPGVVAGARDAEHELRNDCGASKCQPNRVNPTPVGRTTSACARTPSWSAGASLTM
jgi:hypothetical protein